MKLNQFSLIPFIHHQTHQRFYHSNNHHSPSLAFVKHPLHFHQKHYQKTLTSFQQEKQHYLPKHSYYQHRYRNYIPKPHHMHNSKRQKKDSILVLSAAARAQIQAQSIPSFSFDTSTMAQTNSSTATNATASSSYHTAVSKLSSQTSSFSSSSCRHRRPSSLSLSISPKNYIPFTDMGSISISGIRNNNGVVVARIIPQQYKDYNAHKPDTFRIRDIQLLSNFHALIQEYFDDIDATGATTGAAAVDTIDTPIEEKEGRNIIPSYFHDRNYITEKLVCFIDTGNTNTTSSIDINGKEQDSTSEQEKSPSSSDLCVVLDLNVNIPIPMSNHSTNDNHQTTSSKNTTSTTTKYEPIQVLMNRDGDENATRTLERLYISTNKKLTKLMNAQSSKNNKKKKKKKKCNNNSNSTLHNTSSNHDDGCNNSSIPFIHVDLETSESTTTTTTTASNVDSTTASSVSHNKVDIDNVTTVNLLRQMDTTIHNHYKKQTKTTTSKQQQQQQPPNRHNEYRITIPSSSNHTQNLPLISNPPTIISIQTPFENFQNEIYVGIPITIQTKLLHSNKVIVSWFVDNDTLVAYDSLFFIPSSDHIGKVVSVLIQPLYVIDNSDGDGNDKEQQPTILIGEEEVYQFQNRVEPLPSLPIVSPLRDEFRTMQRNQRTIRVVTYNILADLYVSRDLDDNGTNNNKEETTPSTATTSTPFTHVKNYNLLRKTRRIPMILAELLSYKADIICLQEVDGGLIYTSFIEPVLNVMNYNGYYSNKASCQREGCAMFWSREVFDNDDNVEGYGTDDLKSFSLRELFELDQKNEEERENPISSSCGPLVTTKTESISGWDESMNGIKTLLQSHDELRKVTIDKIGQIVQIATLRLKDPNTSFGIDSSSTDCSSDKATTSKSSSLSPPKKIVVANTHLFYHPMADHIRALQAFVTCKKLDEIRRQTDDINDSSSSSSSSTTNTTHRPYPILLCGDLNSDPLSGAAQLLFTRELHPEHHDCWKNLHEYKWDCGESEFMLEHGYVGNDVGVTELKYEEESFDNATDGRAQSTSSPTATAVTTATTKTLPSPPMIVLPDCFPSLQSGCLEVPKFTNYAVDFIDTLDYILVSEQSSKEPFGFVPKRSSPMPTEKDITKYIAMPNECMPSDHVSVVCDIECTKFDAS